MSKGKGFDLTNLLGGKGLAALIVGVGLLCLGYIVVFLGAEWDAASVGLAFCAMTLSYVLVQCYRITQVVTTMHEPNAALPSEEYFVHGEMASLRQEKRRLLQAIKELEFDFSMGKLSPSDYEDIVGRYKLRAART